MTAPDTRAVRHRLKWIERHGLDADDAVWLLDWAAAACDRIDALAALRPRVDPHEPTVAALICEETMD